MKLANLIRSLIKRITGKKQEARSPELWMQRILAGRDVEVVFDVGGNTGEWSDIILKSLSPKKIFIFEPFTIHYENLRKRYANYYAVSVLDVAMSNIDGEGIFHINSDPRYNHSLLSIDSTSDGWAKVEHVETLKVKCRTVDQFCEEHRISHINLMKIDTEGADFLVLQGSRQMLKSRRIDIIYTEIFLKPLMEGQGSLAGTIDFMDSLGYSLFNFFDQRYRGGRLVLTNAMFVRKELL